MNRTSPTPKMHIRSSWIIVMILSAFIVLSAGQLSAKDSAGELTPDWVKDLVIYEIATKSFTSPDGPESGTFLALKDKMPYLEDLGINAIWLTGHSLSDPQHFYGIWTQYACIEPDKLDPSLGTEDDFKAMIAEAHDRGIRIFLDTIEHGVMNYSPLVTEHPEWFEGNSWGMTDYDWKGDHPDLEEWWVSMWTKAVLDWGIDGFRCDMGLHRPDLWEAIRQRCFDAGKSIFILGESGKETVSDATQRDIMLFDQRVGLSANHTVLHNLPAMNNLFHKPFDPIGVTFTCEVDYEDGTSAIDDGRGGTIKLAYTGVGDDVIGTWEKDADGIPDWNWAISGLDPNRAIAKITVRCPERSWMWQSDPKGFWWLALDGSGTSLSASGGNPTSTPRRRTISVSNHDCGWDSFPKGKNPYMAQGSRYIMGYGLLFAPAIPIMMAGEEFDADYIPLPNHKPDLFGKGEAGTGTWLYGSWLQWDQLNDARHKAMLKDTKRLIAIRGEHHDLIYAPLADDEDITMNPVTATTDVQIPVPYILTNGNRALLVVANPTDETITVELKITSEMLGLTSGTKSVKMVELWPLESKTRKMKTKKLKKYKVTIPADKTPGGGLHIVRFE